MARSVMVGGLDTAALALREGAGLPLLTDEVPVQAWMTDCLQQAATERRGVVLLGVQGVGKSVAVRRMLRDFEREEFLRKETKDHAYIPRRAVRLTTVRAATAREMYVALYKAAFLRRPEERVYRRTKTTDELREELVARCDEEHVVAFVIDEAQTLTDPALDALRDIMAVAESSSETLIEETEQGDLIRPEGIGVLLVATFAFQPRLLTLPEYGRRWMRVEQVAALEEAQVPAILTRVLPAFADGAQALGAPAWADLIQRLVTQGHRIPISTLHDLARTYIRRAAVEHPAAQKVAQLPWDRDLFEQAVFEHAGLQILGQDAA